MINLKSSFVECKQIMSKSDEKIGKVEKEEKTVIVIFFTQKS
jgi:hypothetical protein